MIRDITIGQYFPGQSAIHKMDPRIKILLSVLYIVMLFVADNMWGLLLGVLFGFIAYVISRIPLSMIWKSMKPVIPIVIFTAVLNLFLSTGDPLWQWKFLKITKEGIETAVFMSVRILCLIAGTSLLTYTTSPIALTDGIERLLSPLKKIKLPVHELAMMMTIALRFIPTLIEETDKMALAMECRCYHGGEGRTRMKQMKLHGRDLVSGLATAAVFAGVILLNKYVNLLPTIW